MWSFVGKKQDQRWLWHAIDHRTGQILTYVFGRRTDEVFLQLKGCWNRMESGDFIQIIGGHISDT